MSLKSGLAAQWGFKAESSWGVPVVVDTFLPLISETLTTEVERLESAGILAGRRVATSDQWGPGRKKVTGGVQTELFNKSVATLFQHFMGDSSSPYTPGDLDGYGLTVQIGTPDVSGTVQPRTFSGCKVVGWELACNEGAIATLGIDLVGVREILVRTVTDGVTTNASTSITSASAAFTSDDVGKPISGTNIPAGATIASVTSATAATLSAAASGAGTGITFTIGVALASASYASGLKPVKFTGGSVTIGGSSAKVTQAKLSAKNGLNTERFFLGQDVTSEPLEADLREYMMTLDVELTDLTQYRRYLNGTEHAVVLTFTDSAGLSLAITTNVRFDGKTPYVSGRGLVTQSIPMKCVASGADSTAISIALTEAS
ncbi:MAG: hypothetical protein FJW95_08205 [Actinobacteria bacterium]|nr:hypothetical protein [Actinomycetota bacterium]